MVCFAIPDKLTGKDIKAIRNKMNLTQAAFAELVNVSPKTIERWESGEKEITGPIVTLVKVLNEYPQIEEELTIPDKIYSLRLWYMCGDDVCTVIDVDERKRRVRIYNYVHDYMYRAFGKEEHPTFEDYEKFLESRCFPRTRDKMKLILKDLDLPFYDPFMIIEKTQGRMAEDDFWIRIER
jgi:putative transcriptional regulator